MSFAADVSGLAGLPVIGFLAIVFALTGHWQQTWQLFIGTAITYAIIIAVRAKLFKDRPKKKPYTAGNFIEKMWANSLVSLHTARATLLTFVLAQFFNSITFMMLFAVIVPIVAFSRYYLKQHYVVDLFTALVVGIIGSAIALYLF